MSGVPGFTVEIKWAVSWVVSDGKAPEQQHQQHWLPSVCNVTGHEGPFITLSKHDRGLARALGFDCTSPNPYTGVQTFLLIARLRDNAVDRHLAESRHMADPMSDNVANSIVGSRQCDRLTACPPFLTITLPPVALEDGLTRWSR